jgi:hypothetical protein
MRADAPGAGLEYATCKAGGRELSVECHPSLNIIRELSCLMKEPRKKNPTFGIAIFIVVAVLVVIATLLYNAISGKREFDRENASPPSVASAAATAVGATGASQ